MDNQVITIVQEKEEQHLKRGRGRPKGSVKTNDGVKTKVSSKVSSKISTDQLSVYDYADEILLVLKTKKEDLQRQLDCVDEKITHLKQLIQEKEKNEHVSHD